MRGRGRGGSKVGERKTFNDCGGGRGGGFNSSERGTGGPGRSGESRGRFARDLRYPSGNYRGQSYGGRGGGYNMGSYRGVNSLRGKQPGENLRKPVWDMGSLQPFAKDFYQPHPRVQSRYEVDLLQIYFEISHSMWTILQVARRN